MCHLRAESGRFLGFRLRLTIVEGFSNVGQSRCWSTARTGRERCLNMKVKCNAEQLNQKKCKSKLILYTTFQFFNYITVFSILKESLQIYNFKILYRTGNVVRGTRAGSTWRRRGWSELGGTRWRRRTEGKQIVTTFKVDLSLDIALWSTTVKHFLNFDPWWVKIFKFRFTRKAEAVVTMGALLPPRMRKGKMKLLQNIWITNFSNKAHENI